MLAPLNADQLTVALVVVTAEDVRPPTVPQAGSFCDVLFLVISQALGSMKTVSGTKPTDLRNISPLLVLSTTTVACCVALDLIESNVEVGSETT